MAYSDDIEALGPQHRWSFDGGSLDQINSADGTGSGVIYTSPAICEGATNCLETNGTVDRVAIANATDINNSAQTRKAVAGWFATTAIQTPPKRIYGEGTNATCFQFVMAYGNNVMFECVEPTNFTLQVFGPVMQPDRAYHLCGIFEGSDFGNEVRFYVDGVEMTLAEPTNRQPGTANLNSRGVGEFGDPAGTVGVGGDVVLLNAPVNGKWNHWATWDGADAVLTEIEVREELFEKGALPTATISAGTESAMQASLDALADTVRADAPLCIRVSTVTGDGDLTLSADNITFDPLASIHVQYMGTGTLTWRNTNGSNASIVSTPAGGTIIIAEETTITVTVKDAADSSNVSGARVYIEADTGGDLTAGAEIMNATTNGSGVATIAFDYTSDQPIIARVRKGSSATYYKTAIFGGPIASTGLTVTVLVVQDGG